MVYRHAEEGRLTEGERGWPKMALGDRWKRGEKGSDVHYSYILQNEQLLVPCRTQRVASLSAHQYCVVGGHWLEGVE